MRLELQVAKDNNKWDVVPLLLPSTLLDAYGYIKSSIKLMVPLSDIRLDLLQRDTLKKRD